MVSFHFWLPEKLSLVQEQDPASAAPAVKACRHLFNPSSYVCLTFLNPPPPFIHSSPHLNPFYLFIPTYTPSSSLHPFWGRGARKKTPDTEPLHSPCSASCQQIFFLHLTPPPLPSSSQPSLSNTLPASKTSAFHNVVLLGGRCFWINDQWVLQIIVFSLRGQMKTIFCETSQKQQT